MDRLTRRIVNGSADCKYCSGEFMTLRGCSKKCPTRKEQLERLTQYEERLGMEPDEAAERIKSLMAYCERRHETALLLQSSNDALRGELANAKRRLNAMIDQEDYWRKVAQATGRDYAALAVRCRGFIERAWAAEKVLSAKTQTLAEIDSALDWIDSVRAKAVNATELVTMASLTLGKIALCIGHDTKKEAKPDETKATLEKEATNP